MSKKRCPWCQGNALYEKYHDLEWGVPVYKDKVLFEFLILESFQAGLNWLSILKKRENFRKAFADFNIQKVANFTETDKERLLQDAGIVRNKLKIEAAINNAQRVLEIQQEYGSLSKFLWQFVNHTPIVNSVKNYKNVPAKTALSENLSKALKKKNFKFLGPTTVYAFMQAVGMVNDHENTCFKKEL